MRVTRLRACPEARRFYLIQTEEFSKTVLIRRGSASSGAAVFILTGSMGVEKPQNYDLKDHYFYGKPEGNLIK
jgi:hypothetical protein